MKYAMKSMTVALVMVLALAMWAQTGTQAPAGGAQKAPAAESQTKGGCPCCQKKAGEQEMGCCHQKTGQGEAAMCCRGDKEGNACMKTDKCAKAASCADGKCCNRSVEKACCNACGKSGPMAMACRRGHGSANN
jgi:hypothetical protein